MPITIRGMIELIMPAIINPMQQILKTGIAINNCPVSFQNFIFKLTLLFFLLYHTFKESVIKISKYLNNLNLVLIRKVNATVAFEVAFTMKINEFKFGI